MLSRIWNLVRGYEKLKHRADCLFLAGEFARARREYVRARSTVAEGDPRRPTLDALIAQCHRQEGAAGTLSEITVEREDGDEFLPGLEDLFELAVAEKSAERVEAYRILGEAFKAGYVALVQGRASAAVRQLQRAATESPSSFFARLELGRALSLAGRMEEARGALKEAERLSPEDAEGVLLLAAVNIELNRFEEAHEKLAWLVGGRDSGPEASYLLARALAGMNRLDQALETLRETVKTEPRFHEAFFEAGRIMRQKRDVEAAFELFGRACALAPDEVLYNRELARLVLENELDEEAGLAACDRLMVSDEANNWEYLFWIAELYIRRGWRREARDPLTKALQLVPRERTADRLVIEQRLAALEP